MIRLPPLPPHERLLWQGHPAWADHAVLFLFIGVAALRMLLVFRSGEWLMVILYFMAIGVFVGIAAAFHYSVFYQISSQRIRITSGLWTRRTRDIPLDQIQSITVKRELTNRWFDLGALEVARRGGTGDSFVLKGVPDPDRIKQHMDRLRGSPRPSRGGPEA